jgi:hypothetical protein
MLNVGSDSNDTNLRIWTICPEFVCARMSIAYVHEVEVVYLGDGGVVRGFS